MASQSPNPAPDNGSRSGQIQVVLIVFSVITTIVVCSRVFIRLHILKTFGYEDAFMGLAQLLTLGSAVAIGLETKWGLGRHTWMMDPKDTIPYMKAFYSSVIVYNVGTCIVKISILLQYRRIFTGAVMQRLTFVFLAFEGIWAVLLSFLLPMVCMPVAAFWDTSVEGRCLNQLVIWYIMASVNLATDFIVFAMPFPVIHRLQLPRRQKIMLILVFCLAFFTCIISIIRVLTLKTAAETTDASWENADAAMWSFLELATGVLAACLPTLRPLFVRIMPRLFGSDSSRSQTNGKQYGRFPGIIGTIGTTETIDTIGTSTHKSRTGNVRRGTLPAGSDSTDELYKGDLELGLAKMSSDTKKLNGFYQVSVSADGRGGGTTSEGRDPEIGIKATTVVSQQVDFE